VQVAISSGHAKDCQGASDILNEVTEATKVVDKVAEYLGGACVGSFHDTISTTQNENLNRIVNWHNSKVRDLDVSVHFNAYEHMNKPMGTECLYMTQGDLSAKVSSGIAAASGLKDRGPKKRTDLFFLNKTVEPAILIEVCFVDSTVDAELYHKSFDQICAAISAVLTGGTPVSGVLFKTVGKASSFGGPEDTGVSPSEGLAFISNMSQAPQLFLPIQPVGTIGLARRLNPYIHYIACRWDYTKTPKSSLLKGKARVKAFKTGLSLKAFPADWGPNASTDRVADLSPGLMDDLGIQTDDQVEVIFPV
jgi:N-acetylmuramoyl-L-alanine amidase